LQYPFAVAPGPSVVRQLLRKWFNDLEYFGHLAFVVGKNDALGQHVGNHEKPFRRHVPQLNWPAGLHLILGLTAEGEGSGFLFMTRQLAIDPGLQRFQEVTFLFRRQPDQYRHAVAEQNGDAGLAGASCERNRRESFCLEADRIDPVSNIQGVSRYPRSLFSGNEFGFGHRALSSGPENPAASCWHETHQDLMTCEARSSGYPVTDSVRGRRGHCDRWIFVFRRQHQPIGSQPGILPTIEKLAADRTFRPTRPPKR
jgi:hypothetical protein